VLGRSPSSLELATSLGIDGAWTADRLPALAWHSVIDASDATALPQRAVELVEPAGRVVFVGIASEPSLVDSRTLARKDVTAVGILGASLGIENTIAAYASGAVDPAPLASAVIGLDDVARALEGWRPPDAKDAPKLLVDPRLSAGHRTAAY